MPCRMFPQFMITWSSLLVNCKQCKNKLNCHMKKKQMKKSPVSPALFVPKPCGVHQLVHYYPCNRERYS